jgi:putative DNA primase/helicase
VLIVHHADKGGQQRGTSRREDVLDTSISLRRPEDCTAAQGFEVHIEKGRGVFGDDAKPFEACYEIRGNAAVWTTRDMEDVKIARVRALASDGMSVRHIASELGMTKSRVQRLKDKIKTSEGGSDIG